MTTVKISRVVHLVSEKATETFMKRAGSKCARSRHDDFCVITAPMDDDTFGIIRFWAEENGLLAN